MKTVPPTRDVPARVVTAYSPSKSSMFREDKIAHDGGLAHFVATKEGVRVWNNEGSFEAVITKSVDAFAWALVHRTAAEAGTYDKKAFAAGLKKLGIKRELPLKK